MIQPITEPERHFWNLEHLEDRQRRLRVSVPVQGCVDNEAASAAVMRLAARHPRLRSRFPVVDGDLVREELSPAAVSHPCQDAAGARFAIREEPAFRWWAEEGDDGGTLVCEVHHIVADAAAAAILRRQLAAEYAQVLADAPVPDGPAAAPEPSCSAEVRERSTSYWAELLAGARPLRLATRRPRCPTDPARGLNVAFALDEATAATVATTAKVAKTTVPMLLLAYHVCLLQQCSLSDDISLSYAFGNRPRQEREVVDNLTLPLFLRLRLEDEDPTVAEVVAAVRDGVLAGIRNRDYGVNDLWDRLTRTPGHASAFPHWAVVLSQHFFNFYSSGGGGAGPAEVGSPVRTTIVPPFSTSTVLDVSHSHGVIRGRFQVNDDQLPLPMAQGYAAMLVALCRAGSIALGLRLSDAGARLTAMVDSVPAPGPNALIDGHVVSLEELEHLAELAVVGEDGSPSVTVEYGHPGAVTFRILSDAADPAFAARFRRRLSGHALMRAYVALVGRVFVVDRGTGVTTSTTDLASQDSTRAPHDGAEQQLCRLLGGIARRPMGPDDVYVRSGGSLGDLPAVVAGMTDLRLPIPPLFSLFASTPIEVYAHTL